MVNIIGKAEMYCVLCDMLLVFDVILQISLSWALSVSASCLFKICSSSSCHIMVMLKILN